MQEIRWDGTVGDKQRGTIEELLEMAKESMEKEEVAAVVISKGDDPEQQKKVKLFIPSRKRAPSMDEQRIRQIAREELKDMLMRGDPLFKRIMKELESE